eukprot:8684700-Pyramimonas_sp.AAC.1
MASSASTGSLPRLQARPLRRRPPQRPRQEQALRLEDSAPPGLRELVAHPSRRPPQRRLRHDQTPRLEALAPQMPTLRLGEDQASRPRGNLEIASAPHGAAFAFEPMQHQIA